MSIAEQIKTYRANPNINVSSLKPMLKSGAEYQYRLANPIVPTEAMLLGTALDVYFFGMMAGSVLDFATHYIVKPEGVSFSTKDGKSWRDNDAVGKEIITFKDMERVKGMTEALLAEPDASAFFNAGKAQVPVYQNIDVDGTDFPCKGLADWRPSRYPDVVVDLKKAADVESRAFGKQAVRLHYAMQAAFYQKLFVQMGEPIKYFCFVAVEPEPPHAVEIYSLSEDDLTYGRRLYELALRRLIACHDSGKWPSRMKDGTSEPRTGITELVLPTWGRPI